MTRLDLMAQEDIYLGMRVRLTEQAVGEYYRLNSNNRFRLGREDVFTITAIHTTTGGGNVRTVETKYNQWNGRNEHMSFAFSWGQLELDDPNAPAPRKLGTAPEGEGIIGIDHPGIQWLFDDMGKYADEQGYCPQYDALCIRLGIPGRPRDFEVNRSINGLNFHTTVKARSQREANELVAAALSPKQEPADAAS